MYKYLIFITLYITNQNKKQLIAVGSYTKGDKSSVSKIGIPEDGRNGKWIHYYTDRHYYNENHLQNPIKAIQYWKDGKLEGKFTSYFKDGKCQQFRRNMSENSEY